MIQLESPLSAQFRLLARTVIAAAMRVFRHLPTVGALLGLVAVSFAFIGWYRSGSSDLREMLHRLGAVATINEPYHSEDPWTSAAQGCAVVAAGILGLELFRFLAGHTWDRVRIAFRRIMSGLLSQRRILVVGSSSEALWLAEQIARQPAVGRLSPPYMVTHVCVNDTPTDRSSAHGSLMSIEVPRFDKVSLSAVGLGWADEVLLLGDSDSRALEMLSLSIEITDGRRGPSKPRVIRLRLESPEVAERVRAAEWRHGRTVGSQSCPIDVRVWIADDLAARHALRRQTIDWRHPFSKPGGSTELICLGFGMSQRVFALALLRQAHHIDEAPMRIVAIDPEVERAVARLRTSFPNIDSVATIETIAADGFSSEVQRLITERATRPNTNLCIAISVGDVDLNLELALGLPKCVYCSDQGLRSPPVFLRQSLAAEPAMICKWLANSGSRGGLALQPWGGLDHSYDVLSIMEGALDARARRVHQAYLDDAQNHPQPQDALDPLSSRRSWEMLSSFKRDDSRNSADCFVARLNSIGLELLGPGESSHCDLTTTVSPASIDAASLEVMARLEHRRWVVSRLLCGWSCGETRDEVRKVHPSIRPWEELNSVEKNKDYVVGSVMRLMGPGERLVRG